MRTLKVIGIGYLILVVISSTLALGPGSFALFFIVAVAFWLAHRAGALGPLALRTRLALSPGGPPAGPAPAVEHPAPVLEQRLGPHRRALAGRLPEDPLDCEPFVELVGAFVHEPVEERQRLEDEYHVFRRRLAVWERDVEALGDRPRGDAAELERLDAEATEIRAYVDLLRTRAEGCADALENALEAGDRAEQALERARTACERVRPPDRDPELGSLLAAASEQLRVARTCFEEGKERPMTALRLSEEASATAQAVEARVEALLELPTELGERHGQLADGVARARRELGELERRAQETAAIHSQSASAELRTSLLAAERSIEGASARVDAAAAKRGSGALAEALADVEEGEASLARASELARTSGEQLTSLETAAISGRGQVVAAEKEVDRAAAALSERDTPERAEVVARATELVTRARAEIDSDRPDWLSAVELADRASELARSLQDGDEPSGNAVPISLADARASASAARDSAWSWAIVSSDAGLPATPLVELAEEAFKQAVALEAAGDEAAAVRAYQAAERAANDALDDTVERRARRSSGRGRPTAPSGTR